MLVLHAWWGLNETIKAFCRQLAGTGFVAFAPDLYHGAIAAEIAEAKRLGQRLDEKHLQAKREIADSMRFLLARAASQHAALGVVGFSLGAYYALDLAAAEPEHVRALVLFYGTGGADFSRSKADYLGHFAENDPYEPASNVAGLEQALRDAGRPVTFHRYAGAGHWFFEPDRPDAYDAAAAALAWQRTHAFLTRLLPAV